MGLYDAAEGSKKGKLIFYTKNIDKLQEIQQFTKLFFEQMTGS